MKTFQPFDNIPFNSAGLNRQAIFNVDDLPPDIAAAVDASCTSAFERRQLILLGHAGRALWEAVKASGIASENPIDDFTVQQVKRWFAANHPENSHEILYPGGHAIGLQRLGQLAGWHHSTPFKVGIDPKWGTWYAYRAVVIADTHFEPTMPIDYASPCDSCSHKRCIESCPGSAMIDGQFDLAKCVGYRKQDGSVCKATCVARVSCPVGSDHRYCDSQIHHTYSISMRVIEQYY